MQWKLQLRWGYERIGVSNYIDCGEIGRIYLRKKCKV